MKGCAAIHPGQKPGTCRHCARAAAATKAELDAYFASRQAITRRAQRGDVVRSDAWRSAHQAFTPLRKQRDEQRTVPLPRTVKA